MPQVDKCQNPRVHSGNARPRVSLSGDGECCIRVVYDWDHTQDICVVWISEWYVADGADGQGVYFLLIVSEDDGECRIRVVYDCPGIIPRISASCGSANATSPDLAVRYSELSNRVTVVVLVKWLLRCRSRVVPCQEERANQTGNHPGPGMLESDHDSGEDDGNDNGIAASDDNGDHTTDDNNGTTDDNDDTTNTNNNMTDADDDTTDDNDDTTGDDDNTTDENDDTTDDD
ncbi:hypothetical protein EDB84DRAFT_1447168 [Lactarius hengduanensis]|nr:hypothetical protein EDB84DRAFT_1447168 [Lactarius hengduanensis]